MINDLRRGNILWESNRMFLPEHKQALLQRKKELKKIKKPILDEQAFQEIDIIITDSLNHRHEVIVHYWEDGFFNKSLGVVTEIDMQRRLIKMKYGEDIEWIAIDCLKDVERN